MSKYINKKSKKESIFDTSFMRRPNILFACSEANFSAHTYSRKVNDSSSLRKLDNKTIEYLKNTIINNKIPFFVSPNTYCIIEGFEKVSFEVNDPSSPWSYSNLKRPNVPKEKNCLIILDRALEASEDPRPLLRWLRIVLKTNQNSRAIIISPVYKESEVPKTNLLPRDPAFFREWTIERLTYFLKSAGFKVESKSKTESGYRIIEVSSSEEYHKNIIKESGLPSPRSSVILATEHADMKITGGIGSYIKEVELTLPIDKRPIVLIGCESPYNSMTVNGKRANNIIDTRDLLKSVYPTYHTSDWKSASMDMYRAVADLVFIYDQIHTIEFQEYQGIGARVVQAKQAYQLPQNITTVARCHGSQVYIDRASFKWSGMEKADVFELEKISLELADIVSFPTNYLRELYISTGYDIKPENSTILRLPYSYPKIKKPTYSNVRKIIFLGKKSEMKGYPAFFSVIADITDKSGSLYRPNITEVQVIAAHGDASEFDIKLRDLANERGFKLTIESMPRNEVLKTLQANSTDSIVCLPYGGDNHPVTILEMIANHCRFIAYQNGGIPELIPKPFRDYFTCIADPIEMSKKILKLTDMSNSVTSSVISDLHTSATEEQNRINTDVKTSYLQEFNPVISVKKSSSLQELATVLVPIYGTDLEFIKSLIFCLNQQVLKPKEILFINDKSPSKSYVKNLHSLIREYCSLPFRIIDHEVNLGLAGARNTALSECTTKYLINIDSDDIVSSNFIYDYVNFMETHPEYSAVVCALESFSELDEWNRKPLQAEYAYSGLGNCLVLGVSKNIFGHAGACVVTEDARAIGGWDASDRSKWEDWAFFLKMTSLGKKIFNFPKINYYYRVSMNSMVRTYANYPAEMRIARNISGLSIWESHRLYAFIKDEALHTGGVYHSIEPDTLTYKIAKRISSSMSHTPAIKKMAKLSIETSWKITKKIRKK